MKNFKIVPLTLEYARRIRAKNIDDFGNEVYEQVASGKGPCRVSLKPFNVGKDKRLVLKHSPFEIDNEFNQPGPIFINTKEVTPYADIYTFPSEVAANFPLSLIGYNKAQQMIYTKLVGNNDVDDLITNIFQIENGVEYLHVRNSEACCYICKIERI